MPNKTFQSAAQLSSGPIERDTPLFRMLQLVARRVAKRLRSRVDTSADVERRQAKLNEESHSSEHDNFGADSRNHFSP